MINKSKVEIRKDLEISIDKKIVLYAGHLYKYKGVDTVALTAKLLPKYDFIFIGGMKGDIDRFTQEYKDVPNDLLLIPNSAKDQFSLMYTSPIKLFEYMASGTPIVASSLPSIREILDESMSYFAKPDDPQSLKHSVEEAFGNPVQAEEKAALASETVKKYSYTERAKNLISFMK